MTQEKAHLGHLLSILSNQLKRHNLRSEQGMDLTPMQKRVLRFILFRSTKGEVYQKDVEDVFYIRKSTATGILQLLEKNGYIKRTVSKKDGRFKSIYPTNKSTMLRGSITEELLMVEDQMQAGISEEDLAVCKEVIGKMIKNLGGDI